MTSGAINYLKHRANASHPSAAITRVVTTYNVVAALIWRCKALSSNRSDKEKESTLLTSTDIRRRLDPPLPASYCGNGLLYARASARCADIEKWLFPELVRVVAEGISRFTNEYARSVIDLLESNKGRLEPRVEYNVSSWLKLGAEQVMYPWGKPLCVGPVCSAMWVCLLFPSVDGGVSALVTLPPNEMEIFQACFLQFFSGTCYESPVAMSKL